MPARELKSLADDIKKQLGSGVVALVATSDGKASVVVGVTDDLTARLNAVDLVKIGAAALGGTGGGGRADMAQAGGPDPARRRPRSTRSSGRWVRPRPEPSGDSGEPFRVPVLGLAAAEQPALLPRRGARQRPGVRLAALPQVGDHPIENVLDRLVGHRRQQIRGRRIDTAAPLGGLRWRLGECLAECLGGP